MKKIILLYAFACIFPYLLSQSPTTEQFLIQSIEVRGNHFSEPQTVIDLSGLELNTTLVYPSLETETAIENLWKTGLFEDIKIEIEKSRGDSANLFIHLVERNRLSEITFKGIKQKHIKALKELYKLSVGTYLSQADVYNIKRLTKNYFVEKGYFNAKVEVLIISDKVLRQHLQLEIDIEQGHKYKISEIAIMGNADLSDKHLRKVAKTTQSHIWWQPWRKSKFTYPNLETTKSSILSFYRSKGYIDAELIQDSVYAISDKKLRIELQLHEGNPYFIRNINWSGNNKYNSDSLTALLNIKKGDIYSPVYLQQRLFGDPSGRDVSSLYWDDGYLFFQVAPEEVSIEGDSVDLELNMHEGAQASISEIRLSGNTKTSDHVIIRELRTLPGDKFSRSNLIRSQRQLNALGYFNPQTLDVVPIPDVKTGTVALEYKLEERQSDQFQLQFGYNPSASNDSTNLGSGLVGTLQVNFNNFSIRRLFDARAWQYSVPSGDGQRLSLAIQSNGKSYQNYSLSFLEPWFGGKKPTSLGFSLSHQIFRSTFSDSSDLTFRNKIYSASLDHSTLLKFPDDYTRSGTSLSYKYYDIIQPGSYFDVYKDEDRAFINTISLRQTFSRSTIDAPLFSRSGSVLSLSAELTPPYSIFNSSTNYEQATAAEKFKFLEYHKIKFNSSFFFSLTKNLVLNLQANAGYIGGYNANIGTPPFERFVLGGAGLGAGNIFSGIEAVPLRGYTEQSFDNGGAYYPVYNRFVAELRYPISITGGMPMWVLGFAEGGNGYQNLESYNPFSLKKSAGLGIRVQLPMVGLLGLDWGYGFDTDESGTVSKGQFHFIFGQRF